MRMIIPLKFMNINELLILILPEIIQHMSVMKDFQ